MSKSVASELVADDITVYLSPATQQFCCLPISKVVDCRQFFFIDESRLLVLLDKVLLGC